MGASPTTTEYLIADNLAYTEGTLHEATSTIPTRAQLISDLQHNMAIEQQSTGVPVTSWTIVDVQFHPKDGFFGVSFLTDKGNLIIAYEGTEIANTTYGNATIAADAQILLHQTPTQLFADVRAFAHSSEVAAKGMAGFNGNAYVTGQSLGAINAQEAAIYLNDPGNNASGVHFAGGVTFAGTGIPGYSAKANPVANMIDYVDYGDAVGNYASNMPAGTGNNYIPGLEPMDHVGTVVMIGQPGSWSYTNTPAEYFAYHVLSHDADDMGCSNVYYVEPSPPFTASSFAQETVDYLFSLMHPQDLFGLG